MSIWTCPSRLLANAVNTPGIECRVLVPRVNPPIPDRLNAMNVAFRDLAGQVHWRCHPRCERLIEYLKLVRLDDHGLPDKKNHSLTRASDAEGYRVEYLRPARPARRQTVGGRWGLYAPP